jgi:hypothetical protein
MSVIVFVKIVGRHHIMDKTLTLEMEGSDTSVEMMYEIERREDIPVKHQRLLYGGKQLDPTITISEYGLERKGPLYLKVVPEIMPMSVSTTVSESTSSASVSTSSISLVSATTAPEIVSKETERKLFVCIPVDSKLAAAISALECHVVLDRIAPHNPATQVKWQRNEKLHATVLFLGSCNQEQEDSIRSALRRVLCRVAQSYFFDRHSRSRFVHKRV